MDFEIPQKLRDYLAVLDQFIEDEIKPLENSDDNIRFFDHRREHARTDWCRSARHILPAAHNEDVRRRPPFCASPAAGLPTLPAGARHCPNRCAHVPMNKTDASRPSLP